MSRKRGAVPEPPLRSVSLQLGDDRAAGRFPFSIPALRELGTLDLTRPVTFLVGENGSGKSTFLEALAWAVQAVTVGSQQLDRDPTLEHVRPLGRALRPVWNRRVRRGFPRGQRPIVRTIGSDVRGSGVSRGGRAVL